MGRHANSGRACWARHPTSRHRKSRHPSPVTSASTIRRGRESPVYDYLRQAYLINAEYM
jgi:hypothetical protein